MISVATSILVAPISHRCISAESSGETRIETWPGSTSGKVPRFACRCKIFSVRTCIGAIQKMTKFLGLTANPSDFEWFLGLRMFLMQRRRVWDFKLHPFFREAQRRRALARKHDVEIGNLPQLCFYPVSQFHCWFFQKVYNFNKRHIFRRWFLMPWKWPGLVFAGRTPSDWNTWRLLT